MTRRPIDPTRPAPVLEMRSVDVFVPALPPGAEKLLLADVEWTVRAGEHWVVLGPNGAGKSTLLSLAAARRHPSRGTVAVLGGRLGRVDVALLHPRIGLFDWRFGPSDYLDVVTVVMTGLTGTIQPRAPRDGAASEPAFDLARAALTLVDGRRLAARQFGSLSRGEQARVLIARALVGQPDMLLLDEPAAGLDLSGREDLLGVLTRLDAERPSLATVMIAHLLEEVPSSVTHALLLSQGRVVAAGRAPDVLTADGLSRCFGRPVVVRSQDGRWSAVASSPAVGDRS